MLREMIKTHWEEIVNIMDSDIAEQVHTELAPCSNEEFFNRYCQLDTEFENITQF